MIDAKQIRAARALLNWSRDDLAKHAGLSVPALARAETEESQLRATSVNKIKSVMENAGIIFTDGHGVKLRTNIVRIFEGQQGIAQFYDEIYATALTTTREFLQFGLRYKEIYNYYPIKHIEEYKPKMSALKRVIFRAIVSDAERNTKKTDYAHYRYWPDDKFTGVPFYVFGDNMAIVSIRPEQLQVIIISEPKVAEEYRRQFDSMWGLAHD